MNHYLDKTASLTPNARQIICNKDTEHPFTAQGFEPNQTGSFLCRRCGRALFRAESHFASGCGWPSFDESVEGNVLEAPDADGVRTEILCARCNAHLGHVFTGEHYTPNNRRHCVNSASIDFVPNEDVLDTEEAIVAGGCFWGVDYYLRQLSGVFKVEVGYSGGHLDNPTYQDVCNGHTGHYEAVRVVYDPSIISYDAILTRFFEIHDPTQRSGQGPDLGHQYQSVVFYYNQAQLDTAQKLINRLTEQGFDVATQLLPVAPFWPAETSHQNYYDKHHKAPYCHKPVKRFG